MVNNCHYSVVFHRSLPLRIDADLLITLTENLSLYFFFNYIATLHLIAQFICIYILPFTPLQSAATTCYLGTLCSNTRGVLFLRIGSKYKLYYWPAYRLLLQLPSPMKLSYHGQTPTMPCPI